MLARTEHTDQARRGQSAASFQDRCDAPQFDRCEVGRDAYPPSGEKVGIGTVVVASVWLAFYVIAAIDALASGH